MPVIVSLRLISVQAFSNIISLSSKHRHNSFSILYSASMQERIDYSFYTGYNQTITGYSVPNASAASMAAQGLPLQASFIAETAPFRAREAREILFCRRD
jgi:hypothetical protein